MQGYFCKEDGEGWKLAQAEKQGDWVRETVPFKTHFLLDLEGSFSEILGQLHKMTKLLNSMHLRA